MLTALQYDTQEKFISYADIKCKPFKKTYGEQLRLVSDFSVFDFSKLDGIEDEIIEIITSGNSESFIDENRAKIIAEAVRHRIDNLQKIALSHSESFDNSFQESDLEENISEEYDIKIE